MGAAAHFAETIGEIDDPVSAETYITVVIYYGKFAWIIFGKTQGSITPLMVAFYP